MGIMAKINNCLIVFGFCIIYLLLKIQNYSVHIILLMYFGVYSFIVY